jgi:Putative DNA-binding domain
VILTGRFWVIAEAEVAVSEIAVRESADLELKSSLMYHHAKAANNPDATTADLRSDDVVHSSLKSVAAFLTSNGGVLYVGVSDDCRILGIEFDFKLLGAGKQNEDGWELHFRDLVKGNFKDGDNVNDYIGVRFLNIDGRCVSRVEVGPRRRLSFLKFKNSYHLFRRQGNRTEEITIEQVEEFLALRFVAV